MTANRDADPPTPATPADDTALPRIDLHPDEVRMANTMWRWYCEKCRTLGVPAPPDAIRGVIALAWETFTYNMALAKAEEEAGKAMDDGQTRH